MLTNEDATLPTDALAMPRRMRYHRTLEHGDFSLEANTELAPEPNHFYLIRKGEVLLRTDDFRTAERAYRELCRQHWEEHLGCAERLRRMASAWGLLGLEPAHRGAALVIQDDGEPADHARLVRIRGRQRANEARARRPFPRSGGR